MLKKLIISYIFEKAGGSRISIMIIISSYHHDLGKFVCFSQKRLKIKEVESLLKMHFKPQGSSAVDELQKLTD